jgi:uncharacterized repeat protein (TIGR03806 family)
MRVSLFLLAGFAMLIFSFATRDADFERKSKLSEYNFFNGKLSDLTPNEEVVPYSVNSALFSNYAEKLRFIKLPEGAASDYNDSASFEFPLNTVLIKNFYYPKDFRNQAKGRELVETRLLVKQESGWQAYPYIWNKEQTDAFYDPAGETKQISYVNSSGKKVTVPYAIPNKNQCKGCHNRNGKMEPIGTTARQLNKDHMYASGSQNQLQQWVSKGILRNVPESVPALAKWDDATVNLNDRARAYLDANCAHCHSRSGPANTSGLYLDFFENDPGHLGVFKAPVAAGRGAGNFQFDIQPGEPNKSILLFRMKTNDPAIAMPEIGREQIHQEGVALIEEWIRKNTFVKK